MQRNKVLVRVEEPEADGLRADRYISDFLQLCPRSQIKNREITVSINGQEAKLSKSVHSGDLVEVYYSPEREFAVEPENIPLDIIYENSRCIVLNKPRGMVVHPAAGNYTGTLVQALAGHIPELQGNFPDEPLRPGIVHRLDKDTSGILVAAKDPEALEFLTCQFAKKTIKKQYLALVKGIVGKAEGNIQHPIARDPRHRKRFTWKISTGKPAYTDYHVIRYFSKTSFVLLTPSTGRTHQLRVHMLSLGHPIIGDPLYGRTGGEYGSCSLMLHAYKLKIHLPGEERVHVFRAHLPSHFKELVKKFAP